MIISSIIKDQKDLVKILSAENKQIIFLISVGQEYHEGESMRASVQAVYDLIQACADTEISNIADPQMKKRIHGTWSITVIVGDIIQAYNHAHDDASLKEQQVIWETKGNEWLNRNRSVVETLKNAGQGRVPVEIQFFKWREFLERGQSYHFKAYYDFLCEQYAKDKGSQFALWTNHKAHRHAHRKSINLVQATSQIQEEWKKTPVTNKYKLKYLLEEFALLLGCISSGLFVNDAKKKFKNSSTTLLYPSNEEQAFRHARILLIEFAKVKQYCFEFPFTWHSLYLLQKADPTYVVVSNSEVQNYSMDDLLRHRKNQKMLISKVYFDSPDDHEKYKGRFPKWTFTVEQYLRNRKIYRAFEDNAKQTDMLLLAGSSGTGKALPFTRVLPKSLTRYHGCVYCTYTIF